MTKSAVLFDFGGVLTTSVLDAFRQFGTQLGAPDLPLELLSKGQQGGGLLVEHEEGRLSAGEFEVGYANLFKAHGVDVAPGGLIGRIQSGLRPDPKTIELVAFLRGSGYRVGLLSNSFGADCYDGYDLHSMFDSVTISAEIGVRKPSRRAYAIACDQLGVTPSDAIMVDDLEQNLVAARRLGMGGVLHRDAGTTRAELISLLRGSVTA